MGVFNGPGTARAGARLLVVSADGRARGVSPAEADERFRAVLHETGLVPVQLGPGREHLMAGYGIALTDLARVDSPGARTSAYDVAGFLSVVGRCRPDAVAFHGKKAAKAVAKHLLVPVPDWGALGWTVAGAPAFVVPHASGSGLRTAYGRHLHPEGWWHELAAWLPTARREPHRLSA